MPLGNNPLQKKMLDFVMQAMDEAMYGNTQREFSIGQDRYPAGSAKIGIAPLAPGDPEGLIAAGKGILGKGKGMAQRIRALLGGGPRAYEGRAPIAGSQGIPHTSPLPNEGVTPRVTGGPSQSGSFGDNMSGTIRGDVAPPPANPGADFDMMETLVDPGYTPRNAPEINPRTGRPMYLDDQGVPYHATQNPAPPEAIDPIQRYRPGGSYDQGASHMRPNGEFSAEAGPGMRPSPGRDLTSDMAIQDSYAGVWDDAGQPMGVRGNQYVDPTEGLANNAIDDLARRSDEGIGYYFDEAEDILPVVHPQYDKQIYAEFEKLISQGVPHEEAVRLIGLQYGDLLDNSIWF
jgi:hypothetical protein